METCPRCGSPNFGPGPCYDQFRWIGCWSCGYGFVKNTMNSPWIDAKERLPEIDQKVLVYFGATGQYTPAVISYHGDDGVWRSVLFWMPIPEVPKPDPFEEWHKQFTDDGSPTRKECRHSGWQAGVQWARSHPEEKA